MGRELKPSIPASLSPGSAMDFGLSLSSYSARRSSIRKLSARFIEHPERDKVLIHNAAKISVDALICASFRVFTEIIIREFDGVLHYDPNILPRAHVNGWEQILSLLEM